MDSLLYLSLPIIIVLLHLFHHFILHRLRNLPPTPFPALPIVGHLHLLRKPPLHKALYDVGKRYGQVLFLRFGSRPVVLVSSAAAAEECFTKNDVVFANRPKLLTGKHLGYNFTSLPFSPYGERWRNLRRISTVEVLSSYRIQQLAGIRAEEVKELVRNLFHLSTCDGMVELKPPLHDFTFNVMSRMIFGKKYYGGGAAANSEAAKLFQEISRNQIRVIPKANVLDFLPFMRWFGFGDIEDELAGIFEKRDEFMQRVIDDHRSGLSHGRRRRESTAAGSKTVLDVLLELQSSEPERYTDETIRNLLLDQK
ncbi:unnamed protein product [Cuscuta campestris]|uniref:Cytochrome P450 n=1 Tax=Cuscuta campestris TaxID=132261 RepID=A0A484K8M6_9ASTE|nr:unnamed protein product [Cuscuta campestris]